MNEWGYVQKTLFMDIQILTSCSFHVMKHYFYFFPNHLKMQKKKKILACRPFKNKCLIWPRDSGLLNPDLYDLQNPFYLRVCMCAFSVVQSCPTLCNPTDYNLPYSSVHAIFQARILDWVAISSSTGSSPPRDRIHIPCISCTGRQILYHCSIWEVRLRVFNSTNQKTTVGEEQK